MSLGCPRNLVDSEVMLGILEGKGYHICEKVADSEVAIVNTCSFIKDAKIESIDTVLELAQLKKTGRLKALIVTGCLPQRYKKILPGQLREVDGFLGAGNFYRIAEVLKKVLSGERVIQIGGLCESLYDHTNPRSLITPSHYAYIKIAEGCSNRCSYCIIHKLKGPYRSRTIESILQEVKLLSGGLEPSGGGYLRGQYLRSKSSKPKRHHTFPLPQGERVRVSGRLAEINLIGQDTTFYGTDLYGKPALGDLLRKLCRVINSPSLKNIRWVRLLYSHPVHFTDDLINLIKNEPLICKYLDLPVQHINDKVLKIMHRKTTKKDILRLIDRLRSSIPGLAIRSSLIVGHPGEGQKEFEELLDFMEQARFERLGIFIYSREEGTAAYNYPGQVPEREKKRRFDEAMRLQQGISADINMRFLGKKMEVLIDEQDENDRGIYVGRTYADAPEVDGQVFVHTGQKELKPGDFVEVKITDTLEYDLVGKT